MYTTILHELRQARKAWALGTPARCPGESTYQVYSYMGKFIDQTPTTHGDSLDQAHIGKTHCAADFSLLNLPKGKSLGRSKPATNS
jgi:hypothetical protein